MGGSGDAGPQPGAGRSADQLRRIADVLGLPLATFFDSSTAFPDDARLGELLRLWLALDREVDRHEVLALMRTLGSGRAET